jgi:DnaJ-class molecular chaperone
MSGEEDLYKILRLDKNASLEEIRRSYKDLSKIHHPDKGGDEEMFKKVNRAAEILSDPEKRQTYDLTGSTQEGGGGGASFPGGFPFPFNPFGGGIHMNVDIHDLFGNMFGGGSRGGPQRKVRKAKGSHKTQELPLSLHDFYHGKQIHIELGRQVFCDICNGDGCKNWKTCEQCKGAGVKETMIQMGPGMMAVNRGPCMACQGEGRSKGASCTGCEQKGLVSQPKVIEVNVKPGASAGDILTFEGMCSDEIGYEKPGDLLFRLVEADEELDVKREGMNLRTRFTISLSESLLGCKRDIKNHPAHKDGYTIDIHVGIQSGETMRVKGKGMPGPSGPEGGDLLVTITVVASESEKKSLESHKAILQSIFI